jgi:hypothetical protein
METFKRMIRDVRLYLWQTPQLPHNMGNGSKKGQFPKWRRNQRNGDGGQPPSNPNKKGKECWGCGAKGHMSFNCPHKKEEANRTKGTGPRGGNNRNEGKNPKKGRYHPYDKSRRTVNQVNLGKDSDDEGQRDAGASLNGEGATN